MTQLLDLCLHVDRINACMHAAQLASYTCIIVSEPVYFSGENNVGIRAFTCIDWIKGIDPLTVTR